MKNKILTIAVGTTILHTSIVPALGTPNAYVQSHYQIGYDDGCAGRVVEGHHTSDYKMGYADGQAACSKSSGSSQTAATTIYLVAIDNTLRCSIGLIVHTGLVQELHHL